jgi:pre-mRNA-splicing factor 38B
MALGPTLPKCRQCKQVREQFEQMIKLEQENSVPKTVVAVAPALKVQELIRSNKMFPVQSGETISELLRSSIQKSNYFKELLGLVSFEQVVEEIITNVSNIEPWVSGATGVPSSLFCCLYRLI